MKKTFLALAAILLMVPSEGAIRLHHLISDHMVLQQNAEARLWGWDEPGTSVTARPSWDGKTYKTKAGADGRWEVRVATPAASNTPYQIQFRGTSEASVADVLVGEVWVAAGQSNMEMPIKGFANCPVDDFNDILLDAAGSSAVRFARIPMVASMTPLDDAECEWKVCSSATVADAGATSYFFARLVSRTLGIPVGIIEANKGGSRVESWLSRENLEKYTDEQLEPEAMKEAWTADYLRPLVWGNGTFHPIEPYTVNGILFYQGCSNVGRSADLYAERLSLLVRQWRDAFGRGDIPFYFVQIAPYAIYDGALRENGLRGAYLREQQMKAAKMIPESAIVGTNDLVYPYELYQIHPAQKRKVGERLGYMALSKLYGHPEFAADAPTFRSMREEGGKLILTFDNMTGGVNRYQDVVGFEIAGGDRVFYPASVSGNPYGPIEITVESEHVPHPVAVRYCFKDFQIGNFGNALGLPLFPFRSDDWEL